jgi:hypothetical protein
MFYGFQPPQYAEVENGKSLLLNCFHFTVGIFSAQFDTKILGDLFAHCIRILPQQEKQFPSLLLIP